MDRRGKGDSGDTEDPTAYSFEREYEDLAAVVGSFSSPVSVAGHSSGATCALGAAVHGVPVASLASSTSRRGRSTARWPAPSSLTRWKR